MLKRTTELELVSQVKQDLIEALSKTKVRWSRDEPDSRWCVHFLDQNGAIRHEIALARWGTGAYVDHKTVRINHPLDKGPTLLY